MIAADVWALVALLGVAYLVVVIGVALVYVWLWWRDRRGFLRIARHRRDRSGVAGTAVGGVS